MVAWLPLSDADLDAVYAAVVNAAAAAAAVKDASPVHGAQSEVVCVQCLTAAVECVQCLVAAVLVDVCVRVLWWQGQHSKEWVHSKEWEQAQVQGLKERVCGCVGDCGVRA